jgi:predicted phosphoribosyltransferase
LVDIFERLTRRIQIKFKDRISAGEILAEALKDVIKKNRPNLMVLGIARGGVVTADIIAKKLSTQYFDIVIPIAH